MTVAEQQKLAGCKTTTGVVQGAQADYMLLELMRVYDILSGFMHADDMRRHGEPKELVLPGHPLHYAVDVLQRHYSERKPKLPVDGWLLWVKFLRHNREPLSEHFYAAAEFLRWIASQINARRAGALSSVLDVKR